MSDSLCLSGILLIPENPEWLENFYYIIVGYVYSRTSHTAISRNGTDPS